MGNRSIYKKESGVAKYITILIVLAVVGAAGFIYLSPTFEQNKPKISFKSQHYWNLKSPLRVELKDDTGILRYKVSYIVQDQEFELNTKVIQKSDKLAKIDVLPPVINAFSLKANAKLKIEVIDISKWNFLNGNIATKTYDIKIDTKKPQVQVISNSYAIRKGGSAVVVVKVKDENLEKSYISFNDKQKFRLLPFYKEDHYAAIIGWDVNIEKFEGVKLIAIDKANNITKAKVPLYIRKLKHSKDKLKVSDKFINNASKVVLEHMNESIPNEQKDVFIKVNQDIREKNINQLREIGLSKIDTSEISSFKLKPFKRLKGSIRLGNYADKRDYIYDGEHIDSAWHLGIDWASVKHAKIYSTNAGEVIFNDYLGIYGNVIIIDHGLGLCSLYAHVSSSDVAVGDKIKAGAKIANTGDTGAVFGDHLHFGIMVQGIEVNPSEWMDKNWIKTRIYDILAEAKKTIDRK